jgi:F-type H+-transporting ATPase subunit b
MLDISPLIMAVTFVIFLTMLYLLNQKLYKPLLKFMDDRDATINQGMSEAQNLSGDTSDLDRQAQHTTDEAKNQAAQLRQSALEELQEEQAGKLAVRQSEIAEKYSKFKASLEDEKVTLKNALLSELPLLKEGLKAKFGQL